MTSVIVDPIALVYDDAAIATTSVTAITARSLNDAAMVISLKKSKAMHIHPMTRVSATKEAEVVALKLKHVCDSCSHIFPALWVLISTS